MSQEEKPVQTKEQLAAQIQALDQVNLDNCLAKIDEVLKEFNCRLSPEITLTETGLKPLVRIFKNLDQPNK